MKNDFAKHVTGFFSNYLSAERGVSPNTMRSYGAAFASFLDFMKEKKGTAAERLTLDHINRKMSWSSLTGSKAEDAPYRLETSALPHCMRSANTCSMRMLVIFSNGRRSCPLR